MRTPQYDQTQFSLEEPLFEGMVQIPPEPVEPTEEKPKIVWYKQRKLVIAAIIGVTIFVILLLFIINMIIVASRAPFVPDSEAVLTPTPAVSTELLDRIEATQEELKEADPNQQQLVFPAVDMEIRLDPEKR